MSKLQDTKYLQNEQYHTSENLNARITLHSQFSANDYGWFKWVFDHFTFGGKAHVLELGCGPGDLWLQNSHRVPADSKITLSDFSKGMVSQARNNLTEQAPEYFFSVIDTQSIPFGEEKFHAVIANHFLYHVPDCQKALAEIHRVLKPGGWFYATTIGENHLEEISNLVERFDPAVIDVFKSDDRPFTLENGKAQLLDWFNQVKIDRYPDSLLITEIEPLVAYILSTVRFDQVEGRDEALANYLMLQMAASGGVIHVKKESGLFTAVKD